MGAGVSVAAGAVGVAATTFKNYLVKRKKDKARAKEAKEFMSNLRNGKIMPAKFNFTPSQFSNTDSFVYSYKNQLIKPIKTCKVNNFPINLLKLGAEFKDPKCAAGKEIESNQTCKASCKPGKKGTSVTYTCNEKGQWEHTETYIKCANPESRPDEEFMKIRLF